MTILIVNLLGHKTLTAVADIKESKKWLNENSNWMYHSKVGYAQNPKKIFVISTSYGKNDL